MNPDCPFCMLAETGTKSAQDFFVAASKEYGLFNFVYSLTMGADWLLFTSEQIRQGVHPDLVGVGLSPEILAKKAPGAVLTKLRQYEAVLFEMLYCRFVDSFQVYLVDILREVLLKRPEILKNRQDQHSLEYILGFPTIDSLVQSIIETKMDALSNEGFHEVKEWFDKKGIPLMVDGNSYPRLVRAVATRNVLVHHRGHVDKRYLRRVEDAGFKEGDTVTLSINDPFKAGELFQKVVAASDQAIIEKFDLPTMPLKSALLGHNHGAD